jgi:hypothetical protein
LENGLKIYLLINSRDLNIQKCIYIMIIS